MLARFFLLYAAMYAAYGVASPFLPAFVNSRGIAPEQLGFVLAAGTIARLLSAPLAGRERGDGERAVVGGGAGGGAGLLRRRPMAHRAPDARRRLSGCGVRGDRA